MCQNNIELMQLISSIINFDSVQNLSEIQNWLNLKYTRPEGIDAPLLPHEKDISLKELILEVDYGKRFSSKGFKLKDIIEKKEVKNWKDIKYLYSTLSMIEFNGMVVGSLIGSWIIYILAKGYKILDAAVNYQLTFQDPASPVMEEIVNFHNYVMLYITFIIFAVLWVLADVIYSFNGTKKAISHKYLIHGTWLEIIWTLIPAVILVFIAFPSFKLIYLIDEVIDAGITIKAIGHQWYWSYEYSDYYTQDGKTIEFDSFMIPTEDLQIGQLRLLEVDNNVIVPTNTNVRVIITATDVLHCWAVPSLGVKLDAVPGRLNQVAFLANREGLFYGQCSEICGANHAFMPIVVEAVSLDKYCNFITNSLK